jgi:aspartate carbamoyltransferase regulatory subunit
MNAPTTRGKGYYVSALRHGTVIDHLSPGTALAAHRALGLDARALVTIGINLNSGKLGRKDIIKIEDIELGRTELNRLALISPEATLSIIRDYRIVAKFRIEMPHEFTGIVRCSVPTCITNHEVMTTRFVVSRRDPLRLRCHYCERVLRPEELEIIR